MSSTTRLVRRGCAVRSFLLCLCLWLCVGVLRSEAGYLGKYPPGCNTAEALQCEYEFLLCKLFGGPANDKPTLCRCASDFYGNCLRLAGVSRCRILLYFFTPYLLKSFSVKLQSRLDRSLSMKST
jgi:hypothetical protein